jgi:hypothetical protein
VTLYPMAGRKKASVPAPITEMVCTGSHGRRAGSRRNVVFAKFNRERENLANSIPLLGFSEGSHGVSKATQRETSGCGSAAAI